MEPNNEENEDSNFNQSQDLLSKTQQDENMSNSNNENELKELYNKLSNLSRTELIEIITKKNDELIELNGKKEESKNNLNILVKNLNELVANNSDILYQKEPDPYVIQQLERVCDLRKRDLNTSRKINNTFKIQYKSMSDRVEHLLTPEKINSFESEIDVLRKENLEMNSKIKVLKDNNIENGKKIENLKDTKKYSQKIKSYTEEIKSLGSKKHDYYTKINSNKKSLENAIKEKEVLIKLYNANIKEDSDEMIVSKINFWLDLIKSDLNGTEEEIIQKVESNQSKVIQEIDKNTINKNVKNPLYLPTIKVPSSNLERSKSYIVKLQKEEKNSKNINQTQINNPRQGIFSKYSLLKNKNQNKSQPRYMLSKNKENSSSDDINKKDELALDYETTTDNDYRELLSKKNEYVLMIHRLQDTMRDHQKNSNRKNKAITNTVSDNSKKLNLIQHQNLLIKNEIENLEKVYQLTLQQINLEKKLKVNESKFIKMNNNININASINSNNNLDNSNINQESIIENLNNTEGKKSIYQNGELKQSNTNISMDNYDSNKKISFSNDISKVEKIEDEYPPYQNNNNLSREKRLQEIKYKYLDVEEENNEAKNNVINEENKNNDNEGNGNNNKDDNKNNENENKKEQNENNEENENNKEGKENNNEENKSINEKQGEEEKV